MGVEHEQRVDEYQHYNKTSLSHHSENIEIGIGVHLREVQCLISVLIFW
jgi:hypothetical protein